MELVRLRSEADRLCNCLIGLCFYVHLPHRALTAPVRGVSGTAGARSLLRVLDRSSSAACRPSWMKRNDGPRWWAALRERLESGDARAQRAEQQLPHRHRRSAHRKGHAVHHLAADRRPSDRATRLQGWVDLLVAGVDDQQRRRRPRQRRRREPAGHSLSGHRAQPERLRLGWRSDDERVFRLRRATPRRNAAGRRLRRPARPGRVEPVAWRLARYLTGSVTSSCNRTG